MANHEKTGRALSDGPRTIDETSLPAVPSAGAASEAPSSPSPEDLLRARCLEMAAMTSTWQAARTLGVPYTTAKRWVAEAKRPPKPKGQLGRPKGVKTGEGKAKPETSKPTKAQIAKAKRQAGETLAGLTKAASYPLAEAVREAEAQAPAPEPIAYPSPPVPQSPAPTPPAIVPLPGCEPVPTTKNEAPEPVATKPVQYTSQPLVAHAAQVLLWRLIRDAGSMPVAEAIKAFDLVTDKLIMMTAARIDADVLRTGKTNEPDSPTRELAQSASPSSDAPVNPERTEVHDADWEPVGDVPSDPVPTP